MRLLWLTPETPEPDGAGGAIRSYHQVRGLAERGVDITIVSPAYVDQAEHVRAALGGCAKLRLALRPASHVAEGLRAVAADPGLVPAAARLPWLAWQGQAFWSRLGPVVASVLREAPVDGVVVEHDFAIAWARRLPAGLPVGLVFHNAYWRYYERRSRPLSALEGRRFRSYVERHAARLSHAWAVSEPDRVEIAAVAPGLDVDVIPNGVDAPRLRAVAGEPEAGRLLFTGTLDYPPNAEAVVWFATEVLPFVRERAPAVRLTVAGRNPPRQVQALTADPAIEVTGWVDDLAPLQRATDVAVAPVRSGGGTKLKVLEALAAGRPLVATSVAAEGIDVEDGVHLLVRDDARSFAAGVAELLADRERAGTLAAAGRERVAARYDWEVLADAMHASLERWLK